MINKEIIYRNGGIERDFINKQIPQYSHMQVNVNCLIPAALLQGLPNYAVMLAMEFKADDAEDYEQRPSLVMFTGKALTIDGIDYIKFMSLLPINYTDKVGRLKLTPYIQTTTEIEVEVDGTLVPRTITAIQQTFTEGYLIVVKASKDTGDTSVEDPEQITALLALINSKRIFYVNEYREAAYGALLWHIWNDYNPALTIYKGAIIMAKYDKFQDTPEGPYKKKTNVYFNCQVTTGETDENYILMLDVETREMTKYYNIERTGTEGAYNYSYQEEKVTYNKAAIDALIQDLWDAKVDKTTKVNGHALSGDITISKSDPGIDLGNVENYGVVSTPSEAAEFFYITAKGVYDYLNANYGTPAQFATNISHLNELYNLLQDDSNNVVDTIHDLLQIFQDYPEAQGMVAVIEDLQERTAALEHATNNGFIVIDRANNTELLTLDPEDFIYQDNPTYDEYPYEATIQDDRFKGAMKVSVLYDVPNANSDNLSSGITLDNTTGTITIYAMETPDEAVIIQEIDIVNSLAAYILYSNNVVAKLNQTAAKVLVLEGSVADLNNTIIPALQLSINAKISKEENVAEGVTKTHIIDNGWVVTIVEKENGGSSYIAQNDTQIEMGIKDDQETPLQVVHLNANNELAAGVFLNGKQMAVIDDTANPTDATKEAYSRSKVDALLGAKQTAALRTTWQTTPDDTHYPSEKLVKDALDGKATAADLAGKQTIANLVTSFSGTPSDSKYPSEKLVKDSLAGKMGNADVANWDSEGNVFNEKQVEVTTGKTYMVIGALRINVVAGSNSGNSVITNTIFKVWQKTLPGSSTLNEKTGTIWYTYVRTDQNGGSSNEATRGSVNTSVSATGQTYNVNATFYLLGALIQLD